MTLTVVFGLVAGWLAWKGRSAWAASFAAMTCLALFVTFVRPAAFRPLNRLWMGAGALLHALVNPLVMSVIFFLLMTPVGIVMRLFGRDALKLRRGADTRSYWVHRTPPGPAPRSLDKPF